MTRITNRASVAAILLLAFWTVAESDGNDYERGEDVNRASGTVLSFSDEGMVVREDDREISGFSRGAWTPSDWNEDVQPGDRVQVSYGAERNEIEEVRVTQAGAENIPWNRWNDPEVHAAPSVERQEGPRTALPQTASRLPLYGLLGLASCAAALAVRWLRMQG